VRRSNHGIESSGTLPLLPALKIHHRFLRDLIRESRCLPPATAAINGRASLWRSLVTGSVGREIPESEYRLVEEGRKPK
jgi:hypothetical protein